MVKINGNFAELKPSYLFSDINAKVRAFQAAHPEKRIIRMGIGDVTKPLTPPVVAAMKAASEEMGRAETFRGYGDEQGYAFLREAVRAYYLSRAGVKLDADEIFISDGAKSDVGNFTDLFSNDNVVIIPNPVYPAYLDSNLMLGRTIKLIEGNEENGFLPLPDGNLKGDIVYLCSPNNPTGAVYTKEQLEVWVDWARKEGAILFFDSAYEAFVVGDELPKSIYAVEGAKEVAVEFCSLSKTAGFTGTRCGYTVVPKEIKIGAMSLNKMWLRRQTTKYNGTAYVIQRAAEAVFTPEGQEACKEVLAYYRNNATVMAGVLEKAGVWFTGGIHSPYIWLKCPGNSWEFFDLLLNECGVVGTPGSGFGTAGEGYFRLTAFNTTENTKEAMARMARLFD